MPVGRVGAQDEALLPGKAASGELGIETPILLDRATGEQFQPGNRHAARPARLGEEACEGRQVRSRQRRGRHRPR